MPIYEYRCEGKCGVFEEIQKASEKPIEKCPNCGSDCHRIVSESSFRLLGGGWYKDGYQKVKC